LDFENATKTDQVETCHILPFLTQFHASTSTQRNTLADRICGRLLNDRFSNCPNFTFSNASGEPGAHNGAFYKSCGRLVHDLVKENHSVSNLGKYTNAFLDE
jgi:hypothetical protein